jgi:hypothetical protein|tara:strand:- start:77 stop:706 length:630 start_codon:yes stop_codon:yes gene_type:complete
MRMIQRTSLFCTLLGVLVLLANAKQESKGWINLYEANSTKGWTPRAKVESFESVDGELHLLSKVNVWVLSDLQMKDFVVEGEVKIPLDYKGFNSGLGFRLAGDQGKPKGYQCEIDQIKPAAIYGIGLGGWIYPNKQTAGEYAQRVQGLFDPNSWNHFRVRCLGPNAKTFLNGKIVAEANDLVEAKGSFGIQHHGKGGLVRFRNLRARPL